MQTRSAFLKSSATKIGGLALLGSGVSLERTAAAFAAEDVSSAAFTLSYGSGLAIGTVAANIDYLWAIYAKKRNVKIDIQYYEPTVIRTALAANKVDLVSFTPLTALALDDLGGNVKVICHTQPVSDYLIVANGDVIKKVKDLEGKRFGTSGAGTIASVVPQVAFTKLGVDWAKVQQVIIGGGTYGRLAAILAGSVDAVAVYHDAGYTAVAQKPNLKILIDTAAYAPSVFSSLMGSQQFLGDPKNHAGIVQALMARAEAERFIHQHPKAWIDI
jgi:ABC-type nitrate/sulfonate/bicarbonate transport system substrate-binding protein